MNGNNMMDGAGDIPQRQPYKVLVRVDDAGRILEINSDAFLTDTDGWTKVDEGHGDRYHHAQGNYLPGPLADERGVYRYKLVDGQAVERSQADMDADYTPPAPVLTAEEMLEAMMGGISDANNQ